MLVRDFPLSVRAAPAALSRPMSQPTPAASAVPDAAARPREAEHLRDLSPQQWKSGTAAWLGWLFDGLELHLYTLIALGILIGAAVVGVLTLVLPPGSERWVFLVGVVPALLVFWIRRHVPEPATWQRAEAAVHHRKPGARELFRGDVASTTLRTTLVCGLGLSA